jgi:hypothetical protein
MGVFDINLGAITVQTEATTPFIPKQLTDPAGSAMWVLVSHGQDGNGAFRADGVRRACGTAAKDIGNCNDDSIFINGVLSLGAGANYFDDMTYYSASRLSSLWTNAQTNAAAGSDEEKDITNRNIGNVGIGLAPGALVDERLEIANALRAKSVMSTKVCDSTTVDCFDQGKFGGPDGRICDPALDPNPDPSKYLMVATRIEHNQVRCDKLEMKKNGAAQACDPGEAVQGIDSLGKIICVVLP